MLLKAWRFMTVILTALSAGLSFAHLSRLREKAGRVRMS